MMDGKLFFPLFVDLSKKKIVFIGAGNIAARRIKVLMDFADNISVVSRDISPDLNELALKGIIRYEKKEYSPDDIEGADIVFAVTDDAVLNAEIGELCKSKGIPVNVCSDHTMCDFYFPGIAKKDQTVIGINAGDKDHKKAKVLTESIKKMMEDK